MRKIKQLCLICFSMFVIISCAKNSINISNTEENNNDLPTVIERVKDSIVLISASKNDDPDINPNQNAMCSGVVTELQYIITNFHCIYNQKFIRIYYWDKNDWDEHEVNIIGLDPLADLALLEVLDRDEPVPFLSFTENEPKEGESVFALGHPMGMAWTVTKGIISNSDRFARHPYIKALQTDAAINQGNSGGPLLNMKGEIVGINALIVSKVKENAGIGIAIRSDIVEESYKKMLDMGKVDRPAIGVMISSLAGERQRQKILKENPEVKGKYIPNTYGLLVSKSNDIPSVLKPWDTIIAVNDAPVNNGIDLSDELYKNEIGSKITLTIIRKRRFMKVELPLKVFPVPVEKMYGSQSR